MYAPNIVAMRIMTSERDRYPLVTSPGAYDTDMIPEYPGLLVPVLGLMLVVLASGIGKSVGRRSS